MPVLKYRGSSGIVTLLDITGTLNRISTLESNTATLSASSGWRRLSANCYYKKVGLWCVVQCDYISLTASTWKTLGTLPSGYRPILTGLGDDISTITGAAFHRGQNNIGMIRVDSSGAVEMFATVASNYWGASLAFPCA